MVTRRPFGRIEDDGPPDMAFVEMATVKRWVLEPGATREVAAVISRLGGVSRFLERLDDDIRGSARGRRDDWIVGVADVGHNLPTFSTLMNLRNAVLQQADNLMPRSMLQRCFLAFDLAASTWWDAKRKGAPMSPALHNTDLVRFAGWGAKLGFSAGLSGLVEALGPLTKAAMDTPLGQDVGDRITKLALRGAGGMLADAAGGALVTDLRKRGAIDYDILFAALPDLLVAGITAVLTEPSGRPRQGRSGRPLRLLLLIDAAGDLEVPTPSALQALEMLKTLIEGLSQTHNARVVIGAHNPLPRIEAKLTHSLIYHPIAPFERANVQARFGAAGCAAPQVDAMLAALCPSGDQRVPAWPLYLVWARRHDLPHATMARDLHLLARRLGPGVVVDDVGLADAAGGLSLQSPLPDLLAEMERKDYVWVWKHLPGYWAVNQLVAAEGGY